MHPCEAIVLPILTRGEGVIRNTKNSNFVDVSWHLLFSFHALKERKERKQIQREFAGRDAELCGLDFLYLLRFCHSYLL